MSDDDRRAVAEELREALLHEAFTRQVERTRRFVEDEHVRVREERTRERNELTLTSGDAPAALAHVGVVAVGEGFDELVGADRLRRADDFLAACAWSPEFDVVGNGAAEQIRLLRHHNHIARELLTREISKIDPVELDLALRDVVKTRDELRDGRLARTRLPDECDGLACGNRKVERLEHEGAILAIAELGPRELNCPAAARDGFRESGGGLGNRRNLPQKRTDLLECRRGRLEGVVEVRDLIDGLEEAPRVQHEREEYTHAQVAREDAESADDENRRDGDVGEEAQRGLVDAKHGDRVEGCAAIVFGERAVFG